MKLTGIKAHLWQRISALYLALYFPYFAFIFFSTKQHDSTLNSLTSELFTMSFSALTLVAIALIISHAWVGIRDIIIDYLPDDKVQRWLKLYAALLFFIVIDLFWLTFQLNPIL